MPASLERTFFVCLNANPLFLNFEPPQEQLKRRRQRGAAWAVAGKAARPYRIQGQRGAPLLYRPSTMRRCPNPNPNHNPDPINITLTLTLTLTVTLTLYP